MKSEELANLTPEEKRIRIAELCGWHPSILMSGVSDGPWFGHKSHATTNTLPDYLNDLNAMHEAEHNSTFHVGNYCEALMEITSRGNPANRTYWNLLHATAAQRADAFLLTLA